MSLNPDPRNWTLRLSFVIGVHLFALCAFVALVCYQAPQPAQEPHMAPKAVANKVRTAPPAETTPAVVPEPVAEPTPVTAPTTRGLARSIAGVEQWRELVARYFDARYVDDALSVMQGESGGNPDAKNPNSSASGLFQHLARYWDGRSAAAGWAGADIFDPEANIAVAAWLSKGGSDWGHWSVKP